MWPMICKTIFQRVSWCERAIFKFRSTKTTFNLTFQLSVCVCVGGEAQAPLFHPTGHSHRHSSFSQVHVACLAAATAGSLQRIASGRRQSRAVGNMSTHYMPSLWLSSTYLHTTHTWWTFLRINWLTPFSKKKIADFREHEDLRLLDYIIKSRFP